MDKRARGRPHLRYKDLFKRDMKAMDMDIERWKTLPTIALAENKG